MESEHIHCARCGWPIPWWGRANIAPHNTRRNGIQHVDHMLDPILYCDRTVCNERGEKLINAILAMIP